MSKGHVHIVGAGIVGLATAATLIERGFDVTLLDREGPAAGASCGNAAAIAWTDVAPLASPGVWKKALKWLADPVGPLSVRPAYALQILPWMLRFMAASSPQRVARSTKALVDLNGAALPAWERLWRLTGTHNQVRRDGCLQLFDSLSSLQVARKGWREQRTYGIEVNEHSVDDLRAMEPALSDRVVGGAFVPGWIQMDEPRQLCMSIFDWLLSRGAVFSKAKVVRLMPTDTGCDVVLDNQQTLSTQYLVIACGAWSKTLASQLGDNVPLDTERGYNITIPDPGVSVKRMVMLPGHGFVLSPLINGLRVGGAVEFGGLHLPPNWQRVDAMLAKAKRFFPSLKSDSGEKWMGFRPSLPDSLPVISPARQHANIFYAFGHAHHGLTQSAITADAVADLIERKKPEVDLSSFDVTRFHRVARF